MFLCWPTSLMIKIKVPPWALSLQSNHPWEDRTRPSAVTMTNQAMTEATFTPSSKPTRRAVPTPPSPSPMWPPNTPPSTEANGKRWRMIWWNSWFKIVWSVGSLAILQCLAEWTYPHTSGMPSVVLTTTSSLYCQGGMSPLITKPTQHLLWN